MAITYLYYCVAYFIFVTVLYLILKRFKDFQVHRRVVSSAGILVLFVSLCYWHGELHIFPPNAEGNGYRERVLWTIAITLFSNTVIQLLIWVIHDFLLRGRWLRLPRFIFNLTGIIAILTVILTTINWLFDADLTGLLVGSTVVSAVIGLAMQDTLGNIISGISLQLESPFKIGDWVILGGHEGRVMSQNWRTISIQTREQHYISLTNKFVSEDKIINYYKPVRRQIHNMFISLGYEHPPNFVINTLNELMMEIKEVEVDKVLTGTFLTEYGDSGIVYNLKFWINDYVNLVHIQSLVWRRVWYTLKRNGINIPFPIRDVRMTEYPLLTADQQMEAQDAVITERIQKLSLFADMNDEQIKTLAHGARFDIYGKDATLVKQGDPGSSMFIITKGSAKITIGGTNKEIVVNDRVAGDFFGEMSLLTGEPRSASVVAAEDMEVVIIDKQGFSEVIIKDPTLLELIVDAVENHKTGLQSVIEEDRKNANTGPKSTRDILMKKIRGYFGLAGES